MPPASGVKDVASLHYRVGGMHCSLCVRSIHRALSRIPGVQDVQVSIADEEVLVRYDPTVVDPQRVSDTLADLGDTVRDPDRAAVFAEEAREVARARRIALAMVAWVTGATLLMAAGRLLVPMADSQPLMGLFQGTIAVTAAFGPAPWMLRNA